MADEKDQLRGHSFDEIEEYDNQLPRWWVYKFLITIAFAVVYLYWYEIADIGKGLLQTYLDVKDAYRVEQALKEKASSQLSEEQLRAMVKDPEVVKRGEAIFATNCVSCHAPDAGGLVGPNLTDDYWIHGGKMTEIVNTITNGVPEKGMISWKNILGPEKIHEVAAFVKSIHGRKTANPKKPEGQLSPD